MDTATEDGSLFGGSKIVSVNPANGKTDVLYQGHVDQRIYTSSMGDHQILDNGNILITESNAGRIIEVNADGQIVWEYINRYSDDEVIRVGNAIRYPVDYFIVKNWSCD